MKLMTQFIKLVTQDMARFMDARIAEGKTVDFNDISGRFSMDSITSCAFGVEASSFKDDEDTIVHYCKKAFKTSNKDLAVLILSLLPGMAQVMGLLGVSVSKPDVTQ